MKYIPADKLIEAIEEIKKAEYENCGGVNAKTKILQEVQELIASLQQEQPEADFEANGIITNAGGQFGYDVATFKLYDNHAFTILLPHDDNAKYGDKVKLTVIKDK